jgi:hypothetical protein|tara:strand:+ start:252 stop:416 length:165 start_codon:yes stop_codon:yes gene_type:complete
MNSSENKNPKLDYQIEYNNARLTKELLEMQEHIKQLEIDMAHIIGGNNAFNYRT